MYDAKQVPLLPIRNAVAFPGVALPFLVKRSGGVKAISAAKSDGLIVIVAQRRAIDSDPSADALYEVGTLAKIEQVSGSEAIGYQLIVRGLSRFKIAEFKTTDGFVAVQGETWADREDAAPETIQVLFGGLKQLALETLELLPGDAAQLSNHIEGIDDPAYLTHLAAAHLDIPIERKQELLENVSLKNRLVELTELLQRQKEALQVQSEIYGKTAEKLGKTQREALLREQLRTIREELGDEEGIPSEDLQKRIEEAGMPDDVRKVAEQELKRLESIGPSSPESHVIRTYIEWLCDMPWSKASEDKIDIEEARAILDQDHYGLGKIKQRILEHLAVMKLKNQVRGSILCFVGPPGVGKTSLGQSIARALGRKFVRASLGGVRDEAEIRGHRRTYIGALPGRILQSIKRAGEKNPVFMLDEIDKLGMSFHGDPASALLEVLDPEQNKDFVDHYLDVPFDLSNVFFVATANTLETIPAPLRDRMEIIELSGYTSTEKLHIAKKYLVPKQLKEHGLTKEQVSFSDEILNEIITNFTREAGVRNLQRKIGALCRASAVRVLKAETLPVRVDSAWLDEILGNRFEPEVSERAAQSGVVTGLAWTPVGGDILFLEATTMPGSGRVTLTGQLGDVMKESAHIALSLVRSKLPALSPQTDFSQRDVHVHVPSGAIPKDGPSAGIGILTAIASLFSGRVVDPTIAMTGEITLRGAVLPVGGIKEKVIAAHRAGIKTVLLSKRNERDLREVPGEVRSQMRFEFVETAADVLRVALGVESLNAPLGSGPFGPKSAVA